MTVGPAGWFFAAAPSFNHSSSHCSLSGLFGQLDDDFMSPFYLEASSPHHGRQPSFIHCWKVAIWVVVSGGKGGGGMGLPGFEMRE